MVSGLSLLLALGAPYIQLHAQDASDLTPALVKALQDDNALVRKRVVIALERLGPKAKVAVPALEKSLKDPDADVRAAAAAALERIDSPRSLSALATRVQDTTVQGRVRAEACRELGERFGQEPEALRALEMALSDPIIKIDAARALEMSEARAKKLTLGKGRHGTRIAMLNLKLVVMNYKRWTEFTEKLKVDYKDYENRVQALNSKFEELKRQAQTATDPKEKGRIEDEGKAVQRRTQDIVDEAKKVMAGRESEELVGIYKEITQVVTSYAQENDFDLVLHYNDATNEAEMVSPENIQRKVITGPATPLYFKAGEVDISHVILDRLNARHASAAPSSAGK
jgi:Skp family chaperone for outer membrane proteins